MQRTLILCFLFGLVLLSPSFTETAFPVKPSSASEQPPTHFKCRWAHGRVNIDGKGKEEVWSGAEWISDFYLPWLGKGGRKARTATKAKLLWDRRYLYFYAEMEDSDLYAAAKERDAELWHGDVFELFLKPSESKPGYYEFQVNPANARLDMFLPRRNAGGYHRFKNRFPFEFDTKVQLEGTLNRWQDKDKGWSVEGRISWKSFIQAGGRPNVGETWKFALCRYDYSVDFEGPELSTCAPLTSKRFADFHRHEDYASVTFVGPGDPQSQLPGAKLLRRRERWTASKVVGSPEPPKPYHVVRAFPELKMHWPICMERVPGTEYMLVINEVWAYAPAQLHLVKMDDDVKTSKRLMKFPGVAYDMAFHPDFRDNGYIFIGSHTPKHKDGPHCQITRYTMKTGAPFAMDSKSAKVIIEWPSDGHNGAAIAFGKDGMLFVTTGDGTVRRDLDVVGQRLDSLRAKVLRIDVDHPAAGKAYAVPEDNPFVDFPGARPEIWCYGMRNPWRITVDDKTGEVWVGNNGQDRWEQIYLLEKGANYGWSVYEGGHPFILEREVGPTPIRKPTFDHPHSEARSLTGGIVYYGRRYPELNGAYIYGDYSTGKIWAAKHDGKKITWHQELADTTLSITCFATNAKGDILIADHRQGGGFYRLEKRPVREQSVRFPKRLSETGLFTSVSEYGVEPGVIAYDVNAPGWHDGASIRRHLAIPASDKDGVTQAAIHVEAKRGWNFPDGTVLMQTLSLPNEKRVETRLLTKQAGEWAGYSYLWNDEQTDAELVGRSGTQRKYGDKSANDKEWKTWHVPSRAECMACHSRAANYVLGLTTRQMNREHPLDSVSQLSLLEAQGYFRSRWMEEAKTQWRKKVRKQLGSGDLHSKVVEAAVTERLEEIVGTRGQRSVRRSNLLAKRPKDYASLPDPFDESESLERRARSYLHANCAHCHVHDGGGNARIVLDWETPVEKMELVNIAPMHGDFGIKEGKLVIPGKPHRSVLVYRLASLGSGRMPRLGSHKIDEKGLELIRHWIEKMRPAPSYGVDEAIAKLGKVGAKKRHSMLSSLLRDTASALQLVRRIDEKKIERHLAEDIVELATSEAPATVRDLFERYVPEDKRVKRLGVQADPQAVLRLSGDPDKGKRLFFSKSLSCTNCHQVGGRGKLLGPDLSKVGMKLKRREMLEHVLNPSKKVDDKFASYMVVTKSGRLLTGLLLKQTKEQVVIKDLQHKTITLSSDDVEQMARQSTSLMPDALLKDLTGQEAADLIAFLCSLQ